MAHLFSGISLPLNARAGYKPAPTSQQSAYGAAHGERIMTFPLMVSLSNHHGSVLRQAQDERGDKAADSG